jgi:hypothetical protein
MRKLCIIVCNFIFDREDPEKLKRRITITRIARLGGHFWIGVGHSRCELGDDTVVDCILFWWPSAH